MKVYFISDLHLRASNDVVARLFVDFLQSVPQPGDSLVIGGDLFDLFVGNKQAFVEKFSNIIHSILAVSRRGVAVHYAEGNHDFHLREVFALEPRIQVHEDAFALNCEGNKIWVAHGDRIDPKDHGYHALRFATRTGFVKGLVRALPNAWLEAVGNWSSRQSRKYNNAERIGAVKIKRTKELFQKYAEAKIHEGYRWVFLGHSHLEDRFEKSGAVYINAGYSSEVLLYAEANPAQGIFELKRYRG